VANVSPPPGGHLQAGHLQAGIGLRSPHGPRVLETRPAVGWLEVHSENYFAAGGVRVTELDKIREHYPLSLHGVGLSLGSVDPLDRRHLENLRCAVVRYQPALVSEHLSWGSVGGRHFNDLLPLPYTDEALSLLVARVNEVQDYLGRQLLVENISSYLQFTGDAMSEAQFLGALAGGTGCGILLDVNNVYVNARNHSFDAGEYLARIPRDRVREIHLGGHSSNRFDGHEILIDTHSTRVCEAVWELYAQAIRLFPEAPTLIEWDAELPELDVLVEEAAKADRVRRKADAIAA
jgi:uncharacterized protein (UPF0276 family)